MGINEAPRTRPGTGCSELFGVREAEGWEEQKIAEISRPEMPIEFLAGGKVGSGTRRRMYASSS